ncbi:hypothetical protein EPA93_19015 [Ktedonosporobacter rubrisoli]|uniref:Uncharacterized protein n=1 Tax=Ktedonosporobacter rubrisoli TaxID=2509675 RepID=A0A4P6JRZ4_KTERU|nr:hypothetical protein [Ktedonosporobacter rubrisoli]QBD77972.1 hypothetical protein EPA93_19015 [Ktedonosporobacter rubrisoli]
MDNERILAEQPTLVHVPTVSQAQATASGTPKYAIRPKITLPFIARSARREKARPLSSYTPPVYPAHPASLEKTRVYPVYKASGRPQATPLTFHRLKTLRLPLLKRLSKRSALFKTVLIVGSALGIGCLATYMLIHSLLYVVAIWATLTICCSFTLSRHLRTYYHVGFEKMLTSLRLKAIKRGKANRNWDNGRLLSLKTLNDTTAYLKALRRLRSSRRR